MVSLTLRKLIFPTFKANISHESGALVGSIDEKGQKPCDSVHLKGQRQEIYDLRLFFMKQSPSPLIHGLKPFELYFVFVKKFDFPVANFQACGVVTCPNLFCMWRHSMHA
jgi:hypothetical protein